MNALIIDDNEMARMMLKELAGRVDDLTIVAECTSAFEAYNLLISESVDVLLLDIEMPGMSGLELTKNLVNKRPIIIFITSKKEYAADAFDLNVADYIIKPVSGSRFIQAIDKAREILESNKEEVKIKEDEFVFIRDSNIIRRLKLDNILFAEAMGDYVKLYTPEKFYAIHATLKAVEERLPASRFLRVHRSYLVALDKIDSMEGGVLVINRTPLPVADAYRSALSKRMNII
ncbi:MAG TPA: LytTR family DNA-binding domain-containing protein [Puia sp.]|jgi:DNA-binding LytR/AlgR family response regulator|nr:LytTR family DNA-binding domain-containing protein [Puia sp.]